MQNENVHINRRIVLGGDDLAMLEEAEKAIGYALRRLANYSPARIPDAAEELHEAAKTVRAVIVRAKR